MTHLAEHNTEGEDIHPLIVTLSWEEQKQIEVQSDYST